jgi:triphosphoribosyl-dephospho-CoA synthase
VTVTLTMTSEAEGLTLRPSLAPGFSPGRLAQFACLLEVTACKPGNVHRFADLPDLHFADFLLSATAIAGPLDQAAALGVGQAVFGAILATRKVVGTNTNLGIVLLLAPLAAVPDGVDLANGVEAVLAATTVEDARQVYRAVRLAQPGGLGRVPDQDVASDPTISLRAAMALAADRDSIALQYANGFREVLGQALPALQRCLQVGQPLETAIVAVYLDLLASQPDSLVARKYGLAEAREVSRRAADVLRAGWPEHEAARHQCDVFDQWLRHPSNRLNPGTTADLVTAALYGALRDGTIPLPLAQRFSSFG